MTYIKDPTRIEEESFKIIEGLVPEEAKKRFSPLEWEVVRRVIHTTGDPAFYEFMRFSPGAVEKGVESLGARLGVFTDTKMLFSGIATGRLKRLGVEASCYVATDEARRLSREEGITRSAAAVEMALKQHQNGYRLGIFAIGNAPTALFRLIEAVKDGDYNPTLVVGTPVGFVGAQESKEALMASGIPYITCIGTRGGSALAASIINQLAVIALRGLYREGEGH